MDKKRALFVFDWERFGPRNLSVPADLEDQIVKLFDELRVDHRVIQYDAQMNLFSKRYTNGFNEHSEFTSA